MTDAISCDGTCGRSIEPEAGESATNAIYWVRCKTCERRFCDRCVASDEKRKTGHCDQCRGTLQHQTPGSSTHIVFAAQDGEATTQMFDRNSIEAMLVAGKLEAPTGERGLPPSKAKTPGQVKPSRSAASTTGRSESAAKRPLVLALIVAIVILALGLIATLLK